MSDSLVYRSMVQPVLGSTSAESDARGDVIKRLSAYFADKQVKDDSISKMRFNNHASAIAAEAYNRYSDDLDGYNKYFNEKIHGCDIPLSQRQEYEALALQAQSRYTDSIVANSYNNMRIMQQHELTITLENMYQSAVCAWNGTVPQSDNNYSGDTLKQMAELIDMVDDDGRPVFSEQEKMSMSQNYMMRTLLARAVDDIRRAGDADVAYQEILSRTYSVDIPSSSGAVTLSTDGMLPGIREQFYKQLSAAVNQENKAREAHVQLAAAQALRDNPYLYHGTNDQKDMLDTLASATISNRPPNDDASFMAMCDDILSYAQDDQYIPTPYVEVMSNAIKMATNPVLSAISSSMLQQCVDVGGTSIVKYFDDDTLVRAAMINDLQGSGYSPEDAVKIVEQKLSTSSDHDAALVIAKKLRGQMNTEQGNIDVFGDDVTAEEYGNAGVSEYKGMVLANILNGASYDAAREAAKARIDAKYTVSTHGYYATKSQKILNTSKYARDMHPIGGPADDDVEMIAQAYRNEKSFTDGPSDKEQRKVWNKRRKKQAYQPEYFYGDNGSESIYRALELKYIPELQKIPGNGGLSADNYCLVATYDTIRHAYDSTHTPTYHILYVDNNGQKVPVVDGDGRVAVYVPDVGTPGDVDREAWEEAGRKKTENNNAVKKKVSDGASSGAVEMAKAQVYADYPGMIVPGDLEVR